MAKKKTGVVRSVMFECVVDQADRGALDIVSLRMSMACNLFIETWLSWHRKNNSFEKVAAASEEWRKTKTKVIAIEAKDIFPAGLTQQAIRECVDLYGMKTRPIALQFQKLQNVMKAKSGSNDMPVWLSVLSRRQAVPSFEKEVGIPFDKHGAESTRLGKPESSDENWTVKVSNPIGQYGEMFRFTMLTRKKKVASQVAILNKIVSGVFEPMGITLVQRDRKWFASIAYRIPAFERKPVDKSRVAVLCPGKDTPWMLRLPGEEFVRSRFAEAAGNMLSNQQRRLDRTRESLEAEEKSRITAHRYGSENTVGHGRKKANRGQDLPLRAWRGIVHNFNRVMAKRIVEKCEQFNVGKLVFMRPDPDKNVGDSTFLSSAGATGARWSGWNWFEVARLLKSKCEECAIEIEFEDRKTDRILDEAEMLAM